MSLVTRCPVCTTAFRVQRAQLAARAGRVRCGKCGTVFDGVAGLVEEPARGTVSLEPSPQMPLSDPSRRAAQREAARAASAPQSEEDEALPPFLVDKTPTVGSVMLWGVLALVAALALAGQITYRYRSEIALAVPAARPGLQAACAALGCEVTLPRRPDLLGIDSSDLQADPQRDNVIVLNALLRNRARFAQEYPALELTLTDEADRAVVRRVLRPADYLDAARAPSLIEQGIVPGAEVQLRVYLDSGRTRATGYRLYLFYP